MKESQFSGEFQSPGGFIFGVQGWMWGEPRPTSITFFLDNTAKVSDQHGRPIRGVVTADSKEVRFADSAPTTDHIGTIVPRPQFATHAQVITALIGERVDWQTLTCAGWPQLTYAELVKLPELPVTPIKELFKIRDASLRKDALRARREADAAREREMQATEAE